MEDREQPAKPARSRSLLGLCCVVGGSGILHLLIPGPYRGIVPAPLRRYAAQVVALSGVCELICAALLLNRRSRRLGAYATTALLVAVFPANVQMTLDVEAKNPPAGALSRIGAWLRLPLQLPLIIWALRQGRA